MSMAGDGRSPLKSHSQTQSSLQLPTYTATTNSSQTATRSVLVYEKSPSSWNTSKLGLRLGVDLCAGASASALVAPIVAVIDRSIVEKVSRGTSLSSCLLRNVRPVFTTPHTFLASKQFLLLFVLYFATYWTANSIDTVSATVKSKAASTVTTGPAKLCGTFAVNMPICVYKDSYFARTFGTSSAVAASATAKMPLITYALFAFRDSLTILASFNFPPLIAPQLAHLPPAVQSQFSRIIGTEAGRSNTAQFMTPAAMQLFSTPIHLLGLDLYNRQGRIGLSDRFARIRRDWLVSSFARMGRVLPAFGLGGVVNTNVRKKLMGELE